jgi:protein phosphatase
MPLELPDFSLVALVGASGSGKSTFARKHFLATEILSSDAFRALVSDDETDQSATTDAFDALHHLAAIRLRRRKLVVVDATNVQEGARKPLLELARRFHAVPVAVVLDVPPGVCHERNAARPNRDFGKHVVERHARELRAALKSLRKEGFRHVYHLSGQEEIDRAEFARVPLRPDRRAEVGPFDVIGDVHGCADELRDLLALLGYAPDAGEDGASGADGAWRHPEGRRVVFVGDLVDRGPDSVGVVRLALAMVRAGAALCVPGNHDDKLKRTLEGRKTEVKHGLEVSLAQIAALPDDARGAFTRDFVDFVEGLPTHLWLDGGKLLVAHAGLPESMHGRSSGPLRTFALYGDITGETDADGLPVRGNWAMDYRGKASVVYGHTPVGRPEWLNGAINIDTGCVFGGRLTALRWPEKELVSVPARETYSVSPRPFLAEEAAAGADALPAPTVSEQWRHDDVPDIADCLGRRVVATGKYDVA